MFVRQCAIALILLAACFATSATAQKSLTEQGFDLYQEGKYEEAAKILEQAVKENPKDRIAHVFLGGSYHYIKRRSEASRALRRGSSIRSSKDADVDSPDREKYRITARSQASLTPEIRERYEDGRARVAVELRQDGTIGFALVISSTVPEWETKVIEAARSMTFIPESRNGVAVTTIVFIDYTFSIMDKRITRVEHGSVNRI
jgi:tetratricopeptide (TPR) repeat protein